jgi:hypothetical protein
MALPTYPLADLNLFPRYQTREDYQKANSYAPPPFDSRRPPKYWLDPDAALSTRNSLVYPNVLLVGIGGAPIPGPDGRPQLDVLVLSKAEAATANIPPNETNVPGATVPEVPMPLRPMESWEQLESVFPGVVRVRDLRVAEPAQPGAFTPADRALLQSIARKLGA